MLIIKIKTFILNKNKYSQNEKNKCPPSLLSSVIIFKKLNCIACHILQMAFTCLIWSSQPFCVDKPDFYYPF